MKYAFKKMRLEADRLVPLITSWAEMQLIVTEERAVIRGFGFAHDIAEAFSALVLDWEATVFLQTSLPGLAPGAYDLTVIGEDLYAARDQQKFLVPGGPVTVEVTAVAEE
jgi:hypothetical protein